MTDKISIIVPVYNVEKYLKRMYRIYFISDIQKYRNNSDR